MAGDSDDSSEVSQTLHYCMRRLISGMSSSRQSAPNGYATAFCHLITSFSASLSVKQLLDNIEQYLVISKQDGRSVSQ